MKDKINWNTISAQHGLSEEFLRNNFTNLNTDIICVAQQLSAEFILDYEDDLDLALCLVKQDSFTEYLKLKREKEVYGEK